VRKVLATLSQQDFTPAIQCDHVYALLSTLAHTRAISFASEDGFALCQHSHRLVKLELSNLPEEWRLMQTRFAVISRFMPRFRRWSPGLSILSCIPTAISSSCWRRRRGLAGVRLAFAIVLRPVVFQLQGL
jgi:hypothetical protein